jgi:hypothetical protein
MAERKVEIGIKTTADTKGADAAVDALDEVVDKGREVDAAIDKVDGRGLDDVTDKAKPVPGSIDALENEVNQLVGELHRLPVGSEEFTRMATRVQGAQKSLAAARQEAGKLGATMGRQGNAGAAVLEFSRAFEDAQYGIRGVLNNLPGLIAMLGGSAGLAGVISLVAVVGSQVWERFIRAPKQAAGETKGLLEVYDDLLKVYRDLNKAAKDDQAEAARDQAASLKDALSGIDRGLKVDVDQSKLAQVRIETEKRVALAEKALELARLEAGALVSGETDALKIAGRRRDIAREIAKIEADAVEARRQAAIEDAKAKVDAEQAKVDAAKASGEGPAAATRELLSEIGALREQAAALSQTRLTKTGDLNAQLDALKAQQAAAFETARNAGSDEGQNVATQLAAAFEPAITALKEQIAALSQAPEEVDLIAQAAAKEEVLDGLAEQLKASAEAQDAAAKGLTDATLALSNLRQTQGLERGGENQTREIDRQRENIEKVHQGGNATVGALEGLLGAIGSPGGAAGKDLAPFVEQINAFLSDRELSADELTKVPTLLAQYFGKIASLGSGQTEAIRTAMGRVDDLERDVRNLKLNAKNPNP